MNRFTCWLLILPLVWLLGACVPPSDVAEPEPTPIALTPEETPTSEPVVTEPTPTATQVVAEETGPPPTPTPTPALQVLSDPTYQVTLSYPQGWEPVAGYQDRYGADDGFFALSALDGEGVTPDEACAVLAEHKLEPYGSNPHIETLQVQGMPACLIWSSEDQPPEMQNEAALVALYPQPVTIGSEVYRYFVLWADTVHMRDLIASLRFSFPSKAAAAPAPLAGPTSTFADRRIGFALDYPADWHLSAVAGGVAVLTSYDPSGAPTAAGLPSGEVKIDIVPDRPTEPKSMAQLLDELRSGAQSVLWEERWELAGALPAVRLQYTSDPGIETAALVTEINSRGLILYGYDAPPLFDSIAGTLRAIEMDPMPPSLIFRREQGLYAQGEFSEQTVQLIPLPEGAAHLTLSPKGYLAFVEANALYVADLAARTIEEVFSASDRMGTDWHLLWAGDGQSLAYALAYEEADARHVELGVYDGFQRQTVAILEARSGPPTAPATPGQPEPGFANLLLLGYDPIGGRIIAAPAGGEERYRAVWAFDALSGRQTTLFNFPIENVEGVSLSPSLGLLAVRFTPAAVSIYDLGAPGSPPLNFELAQAMHAGPLHWSSDGTELAFLLFEGEAPGLDAAPAEGLWLLDVVSGRASAFERLSLRSPEAMLIGWHPDGQALLLERIEVVGQPRRVELVSVEANQVKRFAPGEGAIALGMARLP